MMLSVVIMASYHLCAVCLSFVWHHYNISSLEVLKACDACADMGQLYCSVQIL